MFKRFFAVLILFFSFNTMSYANETNTVNDNEKQVVLYVKEMTCQLCVYLVNKELRAIDGVISTKASFKDRLVKVITQKSVSDETLIKAINKLNYSAIVQN
jgi:Copper chaperone